MKEFLANPAIANSLLFCIALFTAVCANDLAGIKKSLLRIEEQLREANDCNPHVHAVREFNNLEP